VNASDVQDGRQAIRPVIALLVVATIVVACVGAIVATTTPAGDYLGSKSIQTRAQAREALPQGWAFFSKSPRGDVVVPYTRLDGADWENAARGPNVQPRWLFGLNRSSRLTEFDLQLALEDVDDADWHECDRSLTDEECLASLDALPVQSAGFASRLCGEVGVVARPPVPWAFRHTTDRLDGRAVRLTVECLEIT